MGNITETSQFSNTITQIEKTDRVIGGAPNDQTGEGVINKPLQQLANRTRYLKSKIEESQTEAVTGQSGIDGITKTMTLTAAQGVLAPPLSVGAIIEHVELADGSAIQKAHRITPGGVFLTKHIRVRRTGGWSVWTADGLDIGDIVAVAHSATGANRMDADGALRSRTGQPDLFAKLGTIYGAGDGSTNFKVPDLRGEFLRGLDLGRGVDSGRAIGSAQDATWLRTLMAEWAGADVGSGTYAIGMPHANPDEVIQNTGVGGAVPSGARAAGGGGFNTATTDNFIKGEAEVTNGITNRWIATRPRNVAVKLCIVF